MTIPNENGSHNSRSLEYCVLLCFSVPGPADGGSGVSVRYPAPAPAPQCVSVSVTPPTRHIGWGDHTVSVVTSKYPVTLTKRELSKISPYNSPEPENKKWMQFSFPAFPRELVREETFDLSLLYNRPFARICWESGVQNIMLPAKTLHKRASGLLCLASEQWTCPQKDAILPPLVLIIIL